MYQFIFLKIHHKISLFHNSIFRNFAESYKSERNVTLISCLTANLFRERAVSNWIYFYFVQFLCSTICFYFPGCKSWKSIYFKAPVLVKLNFQYLWCKDIQIQLPILCSRLWSWSGVPQDTQVPWCWGTAYFRGSLRSGWDLRFKMRWAWIKTEVSSKSTGLCAYYRMDTFVWDLGGGLHLGKLIVVREGVIIGS